MDPTEWVMKVEDFCASGVPASNYGIVGRYGLEELTERLTERFHALHQRESRAIYPAIRSGDSRAGTQSQRVRTLSCGTF
ncbi:hypothetical protein T4B_4843 [Trichinella pseudospiralis]|uniref:Uncharacterized protein n=1 Tax=Trichinella pseudospiralis TaxID=6337 RepID=A0A0V1JJ66_TRIPS|nr:hypothetical protein T4B_4843 [Trichinella pseudospiralis]KRZ44004.1 hypothetical protein T4C_12132 [Trichinella pseudospiralis]